MLANSPRYSLPFARMLAGLVLVLTAAGCEMMTAGTNLLAIAASPVVTVPMSDGEKIPDIEMKLHGRWCGPNYPTEADKASGKDLTPVDRLDTACMKHDLCYAAHGGKPTCSCDEKFIWRVKYLQYHAPDFSDDGRTKAFLILGWFESSPCSSDASDHGMTAQSTPPALAPDPPPSHHP